MRLVSALILCLPALLAGEITEIYLDPVDAKRDRTVPLKVYIPVSVDSPLPVVLFSHGLGGSRDGAGYLGRHWAENGYAAVYVQHPGSDRAVWENVPPQQRMEALQSATGPKTAQNRFQDIPFALDFLESTQEDPESPLYGKLDLTRIGMTGHSYGAVTTQALMGQRHRRWGPPIFADERLDCFIPMSPSASNRIADKTAFGHIEAPVLCMTGTLDDSPLRSEVTPESRLQVYAALPVGDKFQVNFYDGGHFIFSDGVRRGQERDPRFHPAILMLTTAFLDAYLKNDAEAKAWLQSDAPRQHLIPEDTWEWK